MSTMDKLNIFMKNVHRDIFGGRPMFRHEYYIEALDITVYCNEIVGFFCCICSDD